jgi:hypothetical protein
MNLNFFKKLLAVRFLDKDPHFECIRLAKNVLPIGGFEPATSPCIKTF